MARKRHSDEDILRLLREIEVHLASGSDVATACRTAGISDATYHDWRRRFGGMPRSVSALTDRPDGLSALHSPDCAAAIWRRHPLTAFQDWIDAIEPEQLPKARVMLRPDTVRDVVTSSACQKFHIDAVTARLICTYRGTGMQYVLSQDGGKPSKSLTVPTGAPIVLQGTRWLVSPSIEGVGETRLVLVLDPFEGLGSPAHQLPH